jgi:hypothetical protein
MNTKTKQSQKSQEQRTRQKHGPKKHGQINTMHHDQELPETRMTR